MPEVKPKIVVTQKEGEEAVTKEVLAQSIRAIGVAASNLQASGLLEDDLVSLIERRASVGRPNIRMVLKALRQLKLDYPVKK